MAKDRTRHARRRGPQPERAEMSLSELAFRATLSASAMERVCGSISDAMQDCAENLRRLRRRCDDACA